VDEFLFDTRAGYCEHYSSAFALMMRAGGVPARIVTGYLGGEMNEDYMIVRQSDAHAWTEVYIDGAWQRFDPTAAVAPQRVQNGVSAALPAAERNAVGGTAFSSLTKSMALAWDSVNHNWQRWIVDYNNQSQQNFFKRMGLPSFKLWQLTAIVLAITGIWCLWLLRSPLSRSKQKVTPAEKAWLKFERLLNNAGLSRQKSEAPQAFINRACEQLSAHASDISGIGSRLLSARFAPMTDKAASECARIAEVDISKLGKQLNSN